MARHLGIPRLLEVSLRLKKRNRGACDTEMMLSQIYSLAQGDGAISDVDRLKADEPRHTALGLADVPDSRRLGEYLYRFCDESVGNLLAVSRLRVRRRRGAVRVGLLLQGSGELSRHPHCGHL